jgi:hypothetical protein
MSVSEEKRDYYEDLGQEYTPERYAGWIKFGMWMSRPRVVREFLGPTQSQESVGEAYLEAFLGAVDEVYENSLLKAFWRHGELVANTTREHPFQVNIPDNFPDGQRWYMLNTSLDPDGTWWNWNGLALNPEIPVFALALKKGEAPNREWLVYAHAPAQQRDGVTIEVPDFGDVVMDVPVGGAFLHLEE